MSRLPYMPMSLDDYNADTGHLSLPEHGVYLRLLAELWKAT